jgi:hypothetical protein
MNFARPGGCGLASQQSAAAAGKNFCISGMLAIPAGGRRKLLLRFRHTCHPWQ